MKIAQYIFIGLSVIFGATAVIMADKVLNIWEWATGIALLAIYSK